MSADRFYFRCICARHVPASWITDQTTPHPFEAENEPMVTVLTKKVPNSSSMHVTVIVPDNVSPTSATTRVVDAIRNHHACSEAILGSTREICPCILEKLASPISQQPHGGVSQVWCILDKNGLHGLAVDSPQLPRKLEDAYDQFRLGNRLALDKVEIREVDSEHNAVHPIDRVISQGVYATQDISKGEVVMLFGNMVYCSSAGCPLNPKHPAVYRDTHIYSL